MNKREEILRRLLRAAARHQEPAQMPFGFDTRVLARVREAAPNGSALIAIYARRATGIAVAILALTAAGFYGASFADTNSEPTNEYGMVDSAIQSNLAE